MAVTFFPVVFGWLVPLLGGVGVPLGIPPLPPDPVVAQVVPEDCLFYMNSAGMAAPVPKNANRTELLLAEPEVRAMVAAIEKAIREAAKKSPYPILKGIAPDDAIDVLSLVLTKPAAVYLAAIEIHSAGIIPRGGLVVNLGQDAVKTLPKIEPIVKGMVALHDRAATFKTVDIAGKSFSAMADGSLVWGLRDDCFVLAFGEGEMPSMLKRFDGKPPAWLDRLREDLPLERRSTELYVDLRQILKLALSDAEPRATAAVQAMGLDGLTTLRAVSGLDGNACISKAIIGIDGPPRGLLRLADIKPLAAGDLAPIPRDATFALAFKLNPEQLFGAVAEIVEKLDPRAKERIERQITAMAEQSGVELRNDILKPLGDAWTVFDSPGDGGGLTSITMVLTLKDAKQADATEAKLLALLARRKNMGDGRPAQPAVDTLDFAGRHIHTLITGPTRSPFSPAWCLTDKELIIGLYPQSVKAYLSRSKQAQSLADARTVARVFRGDSAPLKLWYINSRRVFDLVYPLLPAYTTLTARMARLGGIEVSPTILPSAAAIRPHLRPAVAWVRRTDSGLEITQHYTLPVPSMLPAASITSFFSLPAIAGSRDAARRAQSMNNMKQLSLAILNYEQAYRSMPPAYKADANGKPLLSWRVLILPFVEEDQLYKQFHLDESWDSDHNKKLIARMPAVYRSPMSKVAAAWKTNYLTVRGDKTIFSGARGMRIAEIRDGMSNTIMTVEASDDKAEIWTKPDDFTYDAKDPLKGLVGLWPGRFHAGMADGSVRMFPASIEAKTLSALFTRDGGEDVNWDALNR